MLDGCGTAAHVGTSHHCYTAYNFKWFYSGERTEGRRHLKPIRIRVAGIRLACFVNKLLEQTNHAEPAQQHLDTDSGGALLWRWGRSRESTLG